METQSRPVLVITEGGSVVSEDFEELGRVVGEAGPFVRDEADEFFLFYPKGDDDLAGRRGELEGVVHEVDENLREFNRIGLDNCRAGEIVLPMKGEVFRFGKGL